VVSGWKWDLSARVALAEVGEERRRGERDGHQQEVDAATPHGVVVVGDQPAQLHCLDDVLGVVPAQRPDSVTKSDTKNTEKLKQTD